ncbi:MULTISPECIES: hypothetical protein [Staphylococcus]|uniref:hypothetical protein n=1 Tax=Staphylococcus TaxID=1279 RepID=UPI001F265A03|nr:MULTISPECIES: hypothetical protein [Staphylococcus]
MALIKYQFKNYIRTYKLIAPFVTFFTLLIIIYFYSGQPIMSSFASTSMVLLFVTGWITVTIIDAESLQKKTIIIYSTKI